MSFHRGADHTTRSSRVPLLKEGDRLTVEEFERRYEAMPHIKKAELIQGVVYMPSPVRLEGHAEEHCDLVGWIWIYRTHTVGIQCGDNATLRLPAGMNQPQPDACLRVRPEYGGQSRTSADGYLLGSPEFIGEISASSMSYDLHQKLDAYQLNGVQEYLVWRVEDHAIDWFLLRDRKFLPMKARGGILKSKAFPGLWLDSAAMVSRDLARVLQVLQQGLDSEGHQRFVARIAKRHRTYRPPA
jgi:hypothetical protein